LKSGISQQPLVGSHPNFELKLRVATKHYAGFK
jgi:hypothetical protein